LLEEFNWQNKSKNIKQRYCRDCKKAYQRKYYQENKEAYLSKVLETRKPRIAANAKYARDILKSGCIDCGFKDLRALEFDHIKDGKIDGVMTLVWNGASLDAIKKEIEKCEVVCRNCHSIRTINRMNCEPYWL